MSSQKFDQTSVVQFLEKLTGVQEPKISQWRRKTTAGRSRVIARPRHLATRG
jgi:phospholipase C